MTVGDALMTPVELAAYLEIPERTLAQWRHLGRGPRYVKVGRHVHYRHSAVEAWLLEQES